MDFNNRLFSIDSQLTQEDLESLKFLCTGLIPNKKLLAIKSNLELFGELQKQSLIEEHNEDFLAELLYIIGQHSLLKILDTSKRSVQEALKTKRTVSPYRQMLFQLYEEITSEDLKNIVFLLDIPNKYKENKKFLDILIHLEKEEILSEDNLDLLEKVLGRISQELLRTIKDYKRKREIEIARTQSLSFEDENGEKMQYSIEAQQVPSEEKGMESIEIVQQITETVKEIDLMDENRKRSMSDLSLNDQPSLGMYSMDRKQRGYCLVINNMEFMKNYPREGSEKDAESLKNVFEWLGFDVKIQTDLSAQDMEKCLVEFQEKDHTERDCFVCCILTHGESQAVYGINEETIPISQVVSYFSAKNCSTLADKPKLFFIQACQGKNSQDAHAIQEDAVSSVEERTTKTIPNDADVLIGQSTVDGYNAHRHIRTGSWYIQALCENLTKMVPRGEDILSILTKVNKDVSEMEYQKFGKTMKQMPQPAYTLRKKLVFPKPAAPFNPPFQKEN